MKTKGHILMIFLFGGLCQLLPQEKASERVAARLRPSSQNTEAWANIRATGNGQTEEIVKSARWSRIVYRHLDMTKARNAPLARANGPDNLRENLFGLLLMLLREESVPAYEYTGAEERFTEEFRLKWDDLQQRFGLENGSLKSLPERTESLLADEEVAGYYLKEAYFFDPRSSQFVIRPLALCPIVSKSDNDLVPTRYPLFWMRYDDIAPYLRQVPSQLSSRNNSMDGTLDDFFLLRKYEGELYKEQNPQNLSIPQYTHSPEEMKAEQQRIERELIEFEKMINADAPAQKTPR